MKGIDPVPGKCACTTEDVGEYYVYLAYCANGTFYVGYTTNVPRRLAIHNAGQGGRYTRANRPLMVVASWLFNSRAEARRAELRLKRLPYERKRALAEAFLSPAGVER